MAGARGNIMKKKGEKDVNKIEEYQKIIRDVLSAFERVSFPIIVESSTGYKVMTIDTNRDKGLINELSKIADIIAKRYYERPITRDTYKLVVGGELNSFRPNEVGKILEYEISKTFEDKHKEFKVISDIISLKQPGYPDIKIVEKNGRISYVDIKATTRPNVGSPRDFYYSAKEKTLKKIDSDGFHLLLGFIIKETRHGFITTGWKLVDLSKIKVSLKAEFNADNMEIYKKEAVIKERDFRKN